MKVRFSMLVALVFLLAGCAGTGKVVRTGGADAAPLAPSATVYVAVPEPGRYEETVYHGSGQETANILQTTFADYARRVIAGREPEPFDVALSSARDRGADYLVYPSIAHWEDRATEWSGIPDRIEVKIEVVDVDSERTLHSAVVEGESSYLAPAGAAPEELLPKPVEQFVKESYGAVPSDDRESGDSGDSG